MINVTGGFLPVKPIYGGAHRPAALPLVHRLGIFAATSSPRTQRKLLHKKFRGDDDPALRHVLDPGAEHEVLADGCGLEIIDVERGGDEAQRRLGAGRSPLAS
jgi:hypothetical protein